MLKKTITILMMFSALSIMLGHDSIPHHHHNTTESAAHHGHDEEESGKLWHLLAHFMHSGDHLIVVNAHNSGNLYAKVQPKFFTPGTKTGAPVFFSVSENRKSPVVKTVDSKLRCPTQTPLRAPPSSTV